MATEGFGVFRFLRFAFCEMRIVVEPIVSY